MAKSLMYVPGLALPELVVKPAKTAQAFKAKVEEVFHTDRYMREMVTTIAAKSAASVDCSQSLHWIGIPKAKPKHRRTPAMHELPKPTANVAKAMAKLGPVSQNVLALPGKDASKGGPQPMQMTVGANLTPCTAAEFIGQPMPSFAAGNLRPLSAIAAGDTLYIIGHSNANGGSLSYKYPAAGHVVYSYITPKGCTGWEHCEKRYIDPVTLGSLLIDEGLPTGIKFDIALVACFSGGLDNAELQTVQCYAQRLAGTLSARGFRCRVYGATGLTSSKDNQVQVAKGAEKLPDGKILLDPNTQTTLADGDNEPFYRRFFRFFK